MAEALAAELKTMAGWLELDSVAVEPRGDFAGPLAAALRIVSIASDRHELEPIS